MIRTLVADLRGHVGGTVTVAGWVQTLGLQRARTWTPTANARLGAYTFLFRGPSRLTP
jgi:hypothetical protein